MDLKESEGSRPHFEMKTPWEEFHRSQTERLSQIAAKMGVPPVLIADVLQEIWLDAIKHSELFQGDRAEEYLSHWLGTVVSSKSSDALRRLKRPRVESLDALTVEPVDDAADDAVELLQAQEQREEVAGIIEILRKESPFNCRLLCEHILEDRSLPDLATETGLGVHAISCRISRALKMVRARLQE